ncbi:MAG: tRNA (adenosine(37)-N6)-threonylcarbamoyltransferase complex transferase subunit TsaD [Thermodesulfobacteriota bacterium]
MKVLGIETSCDEAAAAVVADGARMLSSVVASQIEVHHPYGGVVPELASRKHIEAVVPVVEEALETAGINKEAVDAVAVTRGPGLVGALLVGFGFAKAFAYARQIPWVGVDHLEAHIYSVFLNPEPQGAAVPDFPYVALLASGGHTSIYHVKSHCEMSCLGQTLDDAAGEAFDKVSKMMGLGYPGGRAIAAQAETGRAGNFHFPRAYMDKSAYDFSFSGIKTAVKRFIQTHPNDYQDLTGDIAAEFQEAVTEVLVYKLMHAAEEMNCRDIAVVGGVAANQRLRRRVAEAAAGAGRRLFIPSVDLCGDNAAMVAGLGYHLVHRDREAAESRALAMDVYSRAARR